MRTGGLVQLVADTAVAFSSFPPDVFCWVCPELIRAVFEARPGPSHISIASLTPGESGNKYTRFSLTPSSKRSGNSKARRETLPRRESVVGQAILGGQHPQPQQPLTLLSRWCFGAGLFSGCSPGPTHLSSACGSPRLPLPSSWC